DEQTRIAGRCGEVERLVQPARHPLQDESGGGGGRRGGGGGAGRGGGAGEQAEQREQGDDREQGERGTTPHHHLRIREPRPRRAARRSTYQDARAGWMLSSAAGAPQPEA